MRLIMGVIKNEHGVYCARRKVPKGLEEAVARVTCASRPRVSWLKRSLRTKDLREANIRAKPVLMEFDQIAARAAAFVAAVPVRADLSDKEIERLADYQYASMLAEDDEARAAAPEEEQLYQTISQQLISAGIPVRTPFLNGTPPLYGLSDRQVLKATETTAAVLDYAKHALARGNISAVQEEIDELLEVFRLNLDRSSPAYLRLGQAVLRSYVAALQAIERRQTGEPVETPAVVEPTEPRTSGGEGLRAALEGWKKTKSRPVGTHKEFENAITRFIELHGDLQIADLRRGHVREFREALQLMPVRRSGALRKASLPQLVEWSKCHPETPKVSAGTVNKLLGAVQAVAVWGRDNGLVPDELPWSDPFSNMRLEEPEPEREPWELAELRVLFASPVFTEGARPRSGRGEAAFWLPLLAIYTGARLGELAPLIVENIKMDEITGITYIEITEDEERGVRTKTRTSRRIVPIHPQLVQFGFVQLVQETRAAGGQNAQLFPLLTQGPKGGYGEAWSKWFGRYIRSIGITNRARVFHSFRHGFKDALRAAGESEDINDALMGQSGGGVGRQYGAKEMLRRFGLPRLAEAVAAVKYPGLDLSHFYVREDQE